MLGSDIVLYARDLATMPSTSFYSDAEAYRAINMQWRRMYSLFLENDDDFYLTKWDFSTSTMTAVTDRQDTYKIAFPTGAGLKLMRLRILQAQTGLQWLTLNKMTRFEFGTTVNTPSYLIMGTELWIIDVNTPRVYQAFYYPEVATIISSTDVNYPIPVIPEILAYGVAMEIRRKQTLDVSQQQAMRDELWQAMRKQLNRDDNRATVIKNSYSNAGLGWPYQ